jgi:hypothetical protein
VLGRREVVADHDGGDITSDGSALLPREVEQITGIFRRFAACFADHCKADLLEQPLADHIARWVYAMALG